VCDAVEYVVGWGLEHRTLESIRAIGVDEIQYAKGRKYLTLVYQIDQGLTRLLWVDKERTIESFQGFFTVLGEQLAAQIEFVCSDMWQPYLDVIRQKCSQALHILDRFHIVAKINQALYGVRAAESRNWRCANIQCPGTAVTQRQVPTLSAWTRRSSPACLTGIYRPALAHIAIKLVSFLRGGNQIQQAVHDGGFCTTRFQT
jgi:transposase